MTSTFECSKKWGDYRVIGESREEVDNEDRVPAGYEVYR